MNKHILKVMRYLDNPELFSDKEMLENADAAYADDDAAYAAAKAAAYTASSVTTYTFNVEYWLSKYFKRSGKSKQDYINEVERLK